MAVEQKRDRDHRIDFLRGVAIFLVLWGHVIQYGTPGSLDFSDNWMYKIIYSFHMPLFTLISGYLFSYSCSHMELGRLLVRKVQSLLQPIIVCGIVYYYFVVVLAQVVKGDLSGIISAAWLPSLGGYWFLWSMLSCSVAVSVAYKVFKTKAARSVGLMIGMVFVFLFPNGTLNAFMYPYFVIGFLYGINKDHAIFSKVVRFGWISIVAFLVMCLFRHRCLELVSGMSRWFYDFYRWIIGLFGSLAVVYTGSFVYGRMPEGIRLKSYFINLGVNSLQIYVLQRIVLENYYAEAYKILTERIDLNLMAVSPVINNLIFTPLVAFVISILILWIIKLLKKANITMILFGR